MSLIVLLNRYWLSVQFGPICPCENECRLAIIYADITMEQPGVIVTEFVLVFKHLLACFELVYFHKAIQYIVIVKKLVTALSPQAQ